MDEAKLDTLRDFIKFAEKFLLISPKGSGAEGGLTPFILNRAQIFTHRRLEAQLEQTGKVRALTLKGRQQGLSTMIQGRNFHKIITTKGNKAFVLAHESDATDNLFKITRRFYDNLPEGLCPAATKLNMSEMEFAQFNSSYKVGTAGNKKTGRSQTIQLFHGSEVGFWENTDALSTGVLQAVSDSPGTEIILESTANGIGNFFHSSWQDAVAGKSEYQAIFIPWYWQNEYAVHVEGFKLTEEEEQLFKSHEKNGLTVNHLTWRRIKISNLNKDEERANDMFKQEYPFTANEAFLNPVQESFIKSRYVARARSNEVESDSALIIGVDPAIGDNDRTAIIRRKGRLAYGLEAVRNHNTMEIAGKLKRIIEQERPFKVYIDCIGIGAGVVDRLQEMGLECVEALNVARTANQKERFANLRAELWSEMRDWLMQNELPVQIPDSDELHGDLCSLGFKHRSNGQLLLESKAELKARGMPSCDLADALMHTFACGQYLQPTSGFYVKPPSWERGMFT